MGGSAIRCGLYADGMQGPVVRGDSCRHPEWFATIARHARTGYSKIIAQRRDSRLSRASHIHSVHSVQAYANQPLPHFGAIVVHRHLDHLRGVLPQLATAAGIPNERVIWVLMLNQVIFIALDFALGVGADRVAAARLKRTAD